ncbi:WS/DGAT/MGAT family O-acyltransferase [Arsenicicoccus dermatophilus]|uniref:WS/DGAT/MGAT family O-acyltransferase n=1 Tax=Arsenicicoccus dermatophilus TaxID=1076331 RepID=UPI001F4C69F7|nr:wax ester/triacylglycerol synthase family O-acyltransferase [Arsenicicoccus dermatophilus]
MSERLTPLDASFLYLERPHAVMHVGAVMVFAPDDQAPDHADLLERVGARLARVPRYRQRVRTVPGGIANPVWVADESFDVTYHVRAAALPRPGTREQLDEFVARVLARPLDRSRPLWELYLVQGLEGGGFAVVTKTHQALVDGIETVDIAQVVLDDTPVADVPPPAPWGPGREPSDLQLVMGSVLGAIRRPGRLLEAADAGVGELRRAAADVLAGAGQVLSAVATTASRPAHRNALNGPTGQARRYVTVATDLDDYRVVRDGVDRGDVGLTPSINDVVLTVVTGAIRSWLESRGEVVGRATSARALVPVGIRPEGADVHASSRVSACFVDLPVGEPSPVVRLHQIAFAMWRQVDRGRAMGADTLAGLAGFASPTLHALGARMGGLASRTFFNLVVTNVPGPQEPRYLGTTPMTETYPVMPVADGQALAIGVTSYDGRVYYGINADRDLVPDLAVLAQAISDSLAELVGRA